MRFLARYFTGLNALFDACLVAIAWATSFYVRFYIIGHGEEGVAGLFMLWFLPLVLITLYFHLKNGFYDQIGLRSFASDAMRMLRSNTLAVVAFIVILYFVSDERISRITIVLYGLISTFLFTFSRALFRSLIRKLRRRGHLLKRIFVVGDSAQLSKYIETCRYLPGTGLKIEGAFGAGSEALARFPDVPFARLEELDAALKENPPDTVVLGFQDDLDPFVSQFMSQYYDELFQIQILAPEKRALIGMTAETLTDIHLMSLNHPRLSKPELIIKRSIDLCASLFGLLLLLPLFSLVAVLIKFTSRGPVFFSQERIGLDGRAFRMWKFRSMRPAGPGEKATGWTVENDPRRTKFGTFLRSTSIDELPQLWNVFVGEMSLVGPRPEQPFFVNKFRREIPAYMLRHKMKSGITGWAQVSGWRGDTSLHRRIECDLYYIRHWSIWFDIKILLLTFVKGFINKNAY